MMSETTDAAAWELAMAAWELALSCQEEATKEARAEIERLRAALHDARDAVQVWGAYASPYLQSKHGLADDLSAIDAALKARA
jgi:hypothetical protein